MAFQLDHDSATVRLFCDVPKSILAWMAMEMKILKSMRIFVDQMLTLGPTFNLKREEPPLPFFYKITETDYDAAKLGY